MRKYLRDLPKEELIEERKWLAIEFGFGFTSLGFFATGADALAIIFLLITVVLLLRPNRPTL